MWLLRRAHDGPRTRERKAPSGLPISKFRSLAAAQLGPHTIFTFHSAKSSMCCCASISWLAMWVQLWVAVMTATGAVRRGITKKRRHGSQSKNKQQHAGNSKA